MKKAAKVISAALIILFIGALFTQKIFADDERTERSIWDWIVWLVQTSISSHDQASQAHGLYFSEDGYVGIGTATPSGELHIKNGTLKIEDNNAHIELIPGGNEAFIQAASVGDSIALRGTDYVSFWTYSDGPTYWSQKMMVNRHGNVGIGLSNPLSPLQVRKTGRHITDTFYSVIDAGGPETNGGVYLGYNTSEPFAGAIASASNSLSFWTADSTGDWGQRLTIKGNGAVGIGTTEPQTKLEVVGDIWTKSPYTGTYLVYTQELADNSGAIGTNGPNGINNTALTSMTDSANHGAIAVYDDSATIKAAMCADPSDGSGYVVADDFLHWKANPAKSDTNICYSSLSGPEASAYIRGTGHLVNGTGVVTFPEHYVNFATLEGMTVHLTPLSAESMGMAVVEKSFDGFVVQELHGGKGTYDFDYMVMAVKKGFENYEVIRPSMKLVRSPVEVIE